MFRRLVRGGEEGEEKSGIVFVEKDFRWKKSDKPQWQSRKSVLGQEFTEYVSV